FQLLDGASRVVRPGIADGADGEPAWTGFAKHRNVQSRKVSRDAAGKLLQDGRSRRIDLPESASKRAACGLSAVPLAARTRRSPATREQRRFHERLGATRADGAIVERPASQGRASKHSIG